MGVDRVSLDNYGGGLTDNFIVIGMHNLLRFCPLFAGILFWPPVLRFPLASVFLSASPFLHSSLVC